MSRRVEAPTIHLLLNGAPLTVPEGTTVAAAIATLEAPCRISVTGHPRGALCGMGICFECRAVIDGVPHCRTCQRLCRNGMRVETQR